MAGRPSVAELWQVVQDQQKRIAELESMIGSGKSSRPGNGALASDGTAPRLVSRAGLLKGAAFGVAGILSADATGVIRSPDAMAAARPHVADTSQANQFVAVSGPHITAFATDVSNGLFQNGAVLFASDLGLEAGSYANNRGKGGNGIGVRCSTGSGTGVEGTASDVNGTGVSGSAPANAGVGVIGQAGGSSGIGVVGAGCIGVSGSASGSGQAGVQGQSSNGPGVYALSDTSWAVRAQNVHANNNSSAIFATTAGSGPGVEATSASGSAVVGRVTNKANTQAAVLSVTRGGSAGV